MTEEKPTCAYQLSKDENCPRPCFSSKTHCLYHVGHDAASSRIEELIEKGDGDWRGFKFPAGLMITDEGNIEARRIDFPINLDRAEISELI